MDKEKMIDALQMALYLMTSRPELARMYINNTIEHIRSNGVANNGFNRTREIVDLGTIEFNDGMDD